MGLLTVTPLARAPHPRQRSLALGSRSDDPLRHLRFSCGRSVSTLDPMNRRIKRRFHDRHQFGAEVGGTCFSRELSFIGPV
jgi:hypothetical protein